MLLIDLTEAAIAELMRTLQLQDTKLMFQGGPSANALDKGRPLRPDPPFGSHQSPWEKRSGRPRTLSVIAADWVDPIQGTRVTEGINGIDVGGAVGGIAAGDGSNGDADPEDSHYRWERHHKGEGGRCIAEGGEQRSERAGEKDQPEPETDAKEPTQAAQGGGFENKL